MRITNNMMIGNLMISLQNNMNIMSKDEQILATGKKFIEPSDDPIAMSKSMGLNTNLDECDQYKKNCDDAVSWLNMTEDAITKVQTVLKRAKDLSLQAANGTNASADRDAIAKEIGQLKSELISLSNSTYAGRYLFSGFKTDQKLIDDNGNYNITVANSETIEYKVGVADRIQVNTLGTEIFGAGVKGDEPKMIKDMDSYLTALATNNETGIQAAVKDMDDNLDTVSKSISEMGAKSNRAQLTSNRLDDDNSNFTKLLSSNEDIDYEKIIMEMTNNQSVYNASLAIGSKVIQKSLVDFLS